MVGKYKEYKRNQTVKEGLKIRSIINKKTSPKNSQKRKMNINFNKYLVDTKSFANNVKNHEEEEENDFYSKSK